MFVMYVDESGDCGIRGSPSDFFVLVGLIVHELRWQDCLEQLIAYRRRMRASFGLRLREELHASALLNKPGDLVRIRRNDRLSILRSLAEQLGAMEDLNLIPVVVDKRDKDPDYDVFEMAWKALIQRFENTLSHRNFQGPANPDDRGMLFPDNTDNKKLTLLLRKMRKYNPIPSRFGGYRNLLVRNIIEDPNFRDSDHSYFVQAADTCAYLLQQKHKPNAYMRRKSGRNYFGKLQGIVCRSAAPRDPDGIVRL